MIFKGFALSPGIAIGKVFLLEKKGTLDVYRRPISISEVKKEIARFRRAVSETKEELLKAEEKVKKEIGTKKSQIFEGYRMILEDRSLIDATEEMIRNEHINAEFAFAQKVNNIVSQFKKIPNDYLKGRAKDIFELGQRILSFLAGESPTVDWSDIEENSVVVAREITVSDTSNMKSNMVVGFVTEFGEMTSHSAILARSLEIPAVSGIKNITENVTPGMKIIVDGINGLVILDPDEEMVLNYKRELLKYRDAQRSLSHIVELPSVTADGRPVSLLANIEILEEIPAALAYGAQGVGLYRSEYILLSRKDIPQEEEQYRIYKELAQKMLPHPVTIRTFDIGADKVPTSIEILPEENPMLGLRAVRLYEKAPQILKPQLRAILRASVYKNLKIMFPMITTVEEVRKMRSFVEEIKKELRSEGLEFDENIPIGAMIETPAAAIMVVPIARLSDFLSIGTNDLIQYVLASDRINPNVTYLYDPSHPAVLELIESVIAAAHQEKKTVSICGEMASDVAFTKLLVGFGADELSMSPIAIPKVKSVIREISFKEAEKFAFEYMDKVSEMAVAEIKG